MARKYETEYKNFSNVYPYSGSYWNPSRAKNIVKHLGYKCTNFDEHMKILGDHVGLYPDEMQTKMHPYKFCIDVFKYSNYIITYDFGYHNVVGDKLLPAEVVRQYRYTQNTKTNY